jgi:molecular chaperone Hsp33
MVDGDQLRRFLFEHSPVRGYLVRLDASWRATIEHHAYPQAVRDVLGEAMAATALVASTLKFDGQLTLQVQGEGPMHLLVTQCSSGLALRGVARHRGNVAAGTLAEMTGDGRVTVTLESDDRETRYQGVVPLLGHGLAEGLQEYFERSEQVPTRLWLAADGERAAGLLLQKLPAGSTASAEDDPQARAEAEELWERVGLLAGTLTAGELLALQDTELLRRLFHEEDVRLFDPVPVSFRCSCSRERTSALLRALGRQEAEEIIAQDGEVRVTCEFCNRAYRFDAVDVGALFSSVADGLARQVH